MRSSLTISAILLASLSGCLASTVIDPAKRVPSGASDADLVNLCRQPVYLQAHPSYAVALKRRGLDDRCYDNIEIKEKVDIELAEQAKRTADFKIQSAKRADMMNTAPALWSSTQGKLFAKNIDDQCYIAKKWNEPNKKSHKNKRAIKANLGSGGLIARDVDIIFDPESDFGAGMSYNGMLCQGAYIVNKSYYPGLGHTWQMTFEDSNNYIYLEGNGKKQDMRVKSWN